MSNKINEITFVCCIESGSLEFQTLRMIESLRKFSGSYVDSPVIAVKPRFGPKISASTLKKLAEMKVTFVDEGVSNSYSWFKFFNKPIALLVAEKYAKTPNMAWLDSDLLFVAEPTDLVLDANVDFKGFPVEDKEMGTTGEGDAYEPLWKAFCNVLEIDINKLPWIITAETNERVRLYFNGGIFVYRRSRGFAESYFGICKELLDSNLGTDLSSYNLGLKEMSSIGFAVIKLNLKWNELPYSHDYVMLSITHSTWYKEHLLRDAKIVHYHDCMWPHFYEIFVDCLDKTHPQVGSWVRFIGPLENKASLPRKLFARLLREVRLSQERRYNLKCAKPI